jgi:hypothetical protein
MVITRKWSVSSAPKKLSCVTCASQIRAENGDPFLQCSLCQKYVHRTCTDINQQQFDLLNRVGSKVRFFCDDCNGHVDEDLKSIQDLREKYEALEAKHDALAAQVQDLASKVPDQGATATNQLPQTGIGLESVMLEVVSELQDQERRKSNIILANVSESPSSDPALRKDADTAKAREIFAIVCPDIDAKILTTFRLGQQKPGAGPARLLKVVVESSAHQQQLVANARELRKLDGNHAYFNVYLNADRTPTQRTLDKARRDRARARREGGINAAGNGLGFRPHSRLVQRN